MNSIFHSAYTCFNLKFQGKVITDRYYFRNRRRNPALPAFLCLAFCAWGFFACPSRDRIHLRDYFQHFLDSGETYFRCFYFTGQDPEAISDFCGRFFGAENKSAVIDSLNRGRFPGIFAQQAGYRLADAGEDHFTLKSPGGNGLKYQFRTARDSFIIQDSGSVFIHRFPYRRYAFPAVLDPGEKACDFQVLGLEDLELGHTRYEECLHIREELPFSELNVWIHRQKGMIRLDYKKAGQFFVAFQADGLLTDEEYSALTGPVLF